MWPFGWHRSAWAHPDRACWCCHSYSLSEGINKISTPGPGEIPKHFALRQQHQQHTLAELHTAVRQRADHYTGHPQRQLALKGKICIQSTRAIRLRGGMLLYSNTQDKLPQTQHRDTCVCCQQWQQVTSLPQRKTNIHCLVDVSGKELALAPPVCCAFKFVEIMGLWPFFTQSH